DDGLLQRIGHLDVAGDQRAAGGHGDVHRAGGGALEVGDAAAGLAYEEYAGGDVPGLDAGVEVGVAAAGGAPGQVERGRAGAAYVLGVLPRLLEAVQVRVETGALARRGAGDEHGAGQVFALGDANALVVELGAGAARGDEQFVAQRVEDHAVQRLGAFAQGDRDAPVRNAVQVVAGAVERVDHPGVAAGAAVALLRAAFLAEDGVVGIGAPQFLDDRFFGQAVDLAGVVHAPLLDHVQRVEPVHVAHQDVAPGARGLDHDVDGRGEHCGLRGRGRDDRRVVKSGPARGPGAQFTIRA